MFYARNLLAVAAAIPVGNGACSALVTELKG